MKPNLSRILKYFLLIFLLLNFNNIAKAQVFYSIGPMLHWNIGDEKVRTSFGIEFAYWNFDKTPYSMDFGIDFQKGKTRLYSELQTGVGLAGLSAGPFMEWEKDSKVQAGLQGSVWFNYFVGVDLRFRWQKGQDYFAPGLYAKLPFKKGGYDNSSGGSSGWDD